MRAWRLEDRSVGPEWRSLEPRAPGRGEIQLTVAFAALNFADLLMIGGSYQDTPPLPFTLGMECSGVVAAVGEGVDLPLGTRMLAFPAQGAFASSVTLPASRCMAVPEGMGLDEAAGFAVAYGTGAYALSLRAGLAAGETLVVLGAAGGVGLTAVELGALAGARVVAVARGAERQALCAAAGATVLLDSDAADLTARLKALGGADVVYDPVGGAATEAALRALKPGGRMLTVGFAAGALPAYPANYLLVKNLTVHGINWSGTLAFAPETFAESLRLPLALAADGRLKPRMSHRFAFDQLPEALETLKARGASGKILLEIGGAFS